ncbi:hypothetical protein GCM10010401_08770 [Rarobacter faecitabidus]
MDAVCKTAQAATNAWDAMVQKATEDLAAIAWGQLSGAFTGQLGTISPAEFMTATDMAGKWIPVMAIATVLVAVLQIIRGTVSMNRASIAKAVLNAALAVPVTFVAIWFAVTATVGFDQLTSAILGSSPTKLAWLFEPSANSFGIGGLLIMGLVWLASMFLSSVMLARTLFVIALIAFAPVATMVIPWDVTRQWTVKWMQTLFAFLIAKPLAAGILMLGVAIGDNLVQGFSTDAAAAATMAVVLMGMACFAPMAALKLVSFTGAGQAADAHGGGDEVMKKVHNAQTTQRIVTTPSRMRKGR